jgi:hypothetical protein
MGSAGSIHMQLLIGNHTLLNSMQNQARRMLPVGRSDQKVKEYIFNRISGIDME